MTAALAWTSTMLRVSRAEAAGFWRARFGLLGAAVVLLLNVVFAMTVWVEFQGHDDALFFSYVMVPTLLLPLSAWYVSQARSSRFLQAVLTTPVTAAQWLAGRVVAASLGAALYVASVVPFFLVHAWHIALPTSDLAWPLVGFGLALACILLGSLLGAWFTSRGSLAAAIVAFVAAVWVNASWMLLPEVVRMEPGLLREAALRLLHTSPALLLMEASGNMPGAVFAAHPAREALAFAILLACAAAAAGWIFARAQAAETWELTPARGFVAAALVAALVASPMALAGTDYVEGVGRGWSFSGGLENATVQIVERGADAAVFELPPWERPDLPAGRAFAADILVGFYLPDNLTGPITDVSVRLDGGRLSIPDLPATVTTPAIATVVLRGGHALPVARIPATVTLESPGNLTEEHYFVHANVTYVANGTRIEGAGTLDVVGGIPLIRAKMAAAGAPAVLACFAGIWARRARTR